MPRHHGRLWCGPPGNPGPPDALGPDHHGSKGRRISCPPFQGILQGDKGKTPLDHDIQHDCGCLHEPLGNGGGRGGGRTGSLRAVNRAHGGAFIL